MRLTIVLLIATMMQVSATSFAQRLTLNQNGVSIRQVFKEIKKQTGYDVLYKLGLLNDSKKINAKFLNANIDDVLMICIQEQNLTFSIDDKTIVIKQKQSSFMQQVISAFAVIDISAKVVDAQGKELAGASVKVKKTGKTANTNASGIFNLNGVADDAILVISYIGYEPLEVTAKEAARTGIVVLKENIGKLDETVVIGYGTTTKRLNTGSVSTVKAEVIESQPVTDPLMALEGRVPGLYLAQSSGIPGAGSVVRLRGKNSIANGNAPFYIIDGVPYSSTTTTNTYLSGGSLGSPVIEGAGLSPFNFLNPADIERIDVLKDADATAIYGSRGANGVILITTKKGIAGQTKLDVNVSTGAGQVVNKLKFLNTSQYVAMRKEAFVNDQKTPGPNDYDVNGTWDMNRYTDWQKIMIGGTGKLTNIQAGISGGSNTTQFLLRGGYTNQTTVFPGNYADRKASVLFNVTHGAINDKFQAAISVNYLNDKNVLPQIDFTSLSTLAPNAPPIYDANGNLNWAEIINPFSNTKKFVQAVSFNLISNADLKYEVWPGLIIKANLGYSKVQTDQTNQTPITAFSPADVDNSALRTNNYGNTNLSNWIIEPQLNYSRKIADGKLSLLVGSTFQENNGNMVAYRTSDYTTDAAINNVATAKTIKIAGINYNQYKYNAIFGRVNFDWKEKYVLNLTARRDGSSRFGPGKQFGNFGAIGAAWIFSDENWVRDKLSFLNYGKLKASYGITGNDQIGDYQYLSTYMSNFTTYQGLPGLTPSRIPNAEFGWEQVRKIELGVELGFLDNRIQLNVDAYRNRSGNQLVGFALPTTTGFTSVQYNLPALIQNTGIEALINTLNISSSDFSWKTSLNITLPRNKLLKYPAQEALTNDFSYVIGKSILGRKSLEFTGVDPETGLYTVKDVNNDGSITAVDYIKYADITQRFYGGLQNTFSYKGFQLGVFFQFVKQDATDYISKFGGQVGLNNKNFPAMVLDKTWHVKGDKAVYQRFSTVTSETAQPAGWRNSSNAIFEDASFIRLKNIMLSYSFSTKFLKKAGIKNLMVYLQGQNLLTFTSYQGIDPEVTAVSTLPPLRMIAGGLQLSL